MKRLEGIKACVFDAYGTLFDFASAAASALARLAPTAVNPLTRKNSLRLHSLVFIGSSLFITPRLRKENYASLLCNTIAFDPQP